MESTRHRTISHLCHEIFIGLDAATASVAGETPDCAHCAGVAGAALKPGTAPKPGEALRPEDAAAGRALLAGHDARSFDHDVPRPSVPMSNVARLVSPSAVNEPSPTCRLEAVSIACMASGETTSLQ